MKHSFFITSVFLLILTFLSVLYWKKGLILDHRRNINNCKNWLITEMLSECEVNLVCCFWMIRGEWSCEPLRTLQLSFAWFFICVILRRKNWKKIRWRVSSVVIMNLPCLKHFITQILQQWFLLVIQMFSLVVFYLVIFNYFQRLM